MFHGYPMNVYITKEILCIEGLMEEEVVSSGTLLDEVLGGGFRRGWITEFYGWNWRIMIRLMHRLLYRLRHLYPDSRLTLVYNQLFGGLDPYSISPWYSDQHIMIVRSFADKDIVEILRQYSKADVDFLVIVDPYLHTLQETYFKGFKRHAITSSLRNMLMSNAVIMLFNRGGNKELSVGGAMLHHLVHVMIRVLQPRNYNKLILVERIKHPLLPYKSLCIDIDTLLGGVQTL